MHENNYLDPHFIYLDSNKKVAREANKNQFILRKSYSKHSKCACILIKFNSKK